jgi:hypothetical protein
LRGYISAWGNYVSCQQKPKDTYECRIVRGQTNIAEEALRRGWVRLGSGAPVEYQKAEQYARRMQKGIWGSSPGENLSPAPSAPTPQSASPSPQEQMTDRIGPSFSCAKATQPLALRICSDQRLSGVDLSFVQAYQALRHANGRAPESGLRREAQEFQGKVLRECGIPQQGPAISETSTKNCIDRLYTEQRMAWTSRLSGPAYQEATRPIERHIALQRDLVQLGYLAQRRLTGCTILPLGKRSRPGSGRRALWKREFSLTLTRLGRSASAIHSTADHGSVVTLVSL